MAEVERISEHTADGVRAGAIVSTMSQAVQELVSNSIDAGATSVEIKLDLPSYRLSVADNGRGIPKEKLQSLVATARATSKASSTEEMQHAPTYGFRGEALHSLGLTSLLEIQSRCAGKEPHAKVVREGQTLHFGPALSPVRAGTIVTLRDAFFKWPVRRKATNEVAEMARIKDYVSRIALVNNGVAFKVQDSAKCKLLLKTTATGNVVKTFAQVLSSDKLSLARKLVFNFKQFRITGFLSPPSSTACHWSKEFQFVYVNCRSVRRLEFVQKTINAAFAPCLALLCGRGGADGQQGVARKARNHNASSGQRQELFPVFVLNIECPRKEVDIMVDPEKTWVEFSDWTAARNACVAMLLAFLPHFSHAVPGSVLRDLRRAFHKNEGGGNSSEAWTQASPPGRQRASPEVAPMPSPPASPLRLAVPDVGVPSPDDDLGFGSPLLAPHGCGNGGAWMGGDRGRLSRTGEEGGEAMEFQGNGIQAAGVLYPSPASRFGARDDRDAFSSRMATTRYLPFGDPFEGRCGDDYIADSSGPPAVDTTNSTAVSPHFASHEQVRGRVDDGHYGYLRVRHDEVDGGRYGDYDDARPTRSPHFSRSNGGSGGVGGTHRDGGRPRRLALEEHPLDGGNRVVDGHPRFEEDRGVGEPPAAVGPGAALPPLSTHARRSHGPGESATAMDWDASDRVDPEGGAMVEDQAHAFGLGYVNNGRGGWTAEEMRGIQSEGFDLDEAFPRPRRRSPPLEPVLGLQNTGRDPGCGAANRAGSGSNSAVDANGSRRRRRRRPRQGNRSGRGSPPIPSREDPGGGWLRHLPGVAEEMLPVEEDRERGESYTSEGGNALSLSRLFDYAFADDDGDRRKGRLPAPVGGRSNGNASGGGKIGARAGFPTGYGEAAACGDVRENRNGRRSLSPRVVSNLPRTSDDGGGDGPMKRALVGVTVRRPPSPKFAFMDEGSGSPVGRGGAASPACPGSPPALPVGPISPPRAWRPEMQGVASASAFEARSRTSDAEQQQRQRRELGAPARSPLRRISTPSNDADDASGETPAAWEPLVGNDSPPPSSTHRRRAERSSLLAPDPGRWTASSPGSCVETGHTNSHSRKRRRPGTRGPRDVAGPSKGSPPLPHGHWAVAGQGRHAEDERRRRPTSTASHVENRCPVGEDDEGGSAFGDGRLAWSNLGSGSSPAHPGSDVWWGEEGGDGPPISDDRSAEPHAAAAAVAAGWGAPSRQLQADDSGCIGGAAGVREASGVDGGASGGRDREAAQQECHGGPFTAKETPHEEEEEDEEEEQARAEDDARKAFGQRGGEGSRPASQSDGNEEVLRSEGGGDGRSGGSSRVEDRTRAADAALAYDQDVLGGDGLGSLQPDTIEGVLGKFLVPRKERDAEGEEECDSCHVSNAGGAAVYSPLGPGGGRARKASRKADRAAEPATAAAAGGSSSASLRARERPISQVLQAGRDEIGAGAGAVAVTVTPEELGEACLIGQAGRKFVILRAKTGAILCVDQHAADERIKLEELERQVYGLERDSRNVEQLRLKPAEKLSITQSDADLLEQHRKVLVSWKFEVEVEVEVERWKQGGEGTAPVAALLLAVPVVCGVRLSVQDLAGFLHYLRESVEPGSSAGLVKPPQVQHILNYKACHSAIRFGDLLSRSECVELIRKLATCAFPFCCAHGRPSVVPLCVLGGTAPSSRAPRLGGGRGRGRWAAVGRSQR